MRISLPFYRWFVHLTIFRKPGCKKQKGKKALWISTDFFHTLSFPQAADYQPCGFQTAPLPEFHCFFAAREPRLKEVPYASLRRSLDVHAFHDGPPAQPIE